MRWKPILVTAIALALISSPISIGHILWRLMPVRAIRMLMVDYSVPNASYRNHKGLFWLLNHRRIFAENGRGPWRVDRDYVGFDPRGAGKGTRLSEVPLDGYDWIYVSDTYGVWQNDRWSSRQQMLLASPRNEMVFGGLSMADATALTAFTRSKGNLILEFNTMADPTGPEARQMVEALAGIRWTGWCGRFIPEFDSVEDDYPWFRLAFMAEYPKGSLPKGPGLMLVHQGGRMIVLSGEPFEESMPSLEITKRGSAVIPGTYGSPPFYDWFSIVETRRGTEVLAELSLPVPGNWKTHWRRMGIPPRSPLVTRLAQGGSMRYYLAANVSVIDDAPDHYQIAGLPGMLASLHRRRDRVTPGPAFWQFYVPLMGRLLSDASTAPRTVRKE